MGGELDGLSVEVQYPAEDHLAGAPAGVALPDLLEGGRLVPVCFARSGLVQYLINGMQEVISLGVQPSLPALAQLDEVVHEDVGVVERPLQAAVGRRSLVVGLRIHWDDSRDVAEESFGNGGFSFTRRGLGLAAPDLVLGLAFCGQAVAGSVQRILGKSVVG